MHNQAGLNINRIDKALDFTIRGKSCRIQYYSVKTLPPSRHFMSSPRFFHSGPLAAHTTVALPDTQAHHAIRVLRLKPDASITLFDGLGGQYPARLVIDGKRGYAALGEHQIVEAEIAGRLTLVQGIASGDKMDWVIEKAVELGATAVAPIFAHRSVLQLSGERLRKRVEHWHRVAQSASEQCGRNRLLEVHEPCTLAQYLAQAEPGDATRVFCHPDASTTLSQALAATATDNGEITLLVGPEGGWSDEELALAARNHLTPVNFGPRVLRTETAGLALIAATVAIMGWA